MFDFWTGTEDLPIYGFLIRAMIIYSYIFFIVRVLGQRTMSSIDALDFIFGVVIGDILGETLTEGNSSLTGPMVAAAVVASLHLLLSYSSLKSRRLRRFFENEPIILMRDGEILPDQLRKTKITLDSFMMDLRLNNVSDLNTVDYAILEMNGLISIIKKSADTPVSRADINVPSPKTGYPTVVIEDGVIIEQNLHKVGDMQWLKAELQARGLHTTQVFIMTVDENKTIYISCK
ncbi:DUF421 domain-containing protein [Shouchella lonarensis]|uniref:Uncharacterized membrane protein YcaP, DUF421 family n=1 Tax=Shouchella lonarensis TaxID=1464122 RepID=A0A1G6HBM9_9BACI|nr:DUF421 domain-containing protein [Shouchella lonarensis]SDB91670.1 Uncharacterized membrane protein YcaP, DUF421 family [Shouchella lonarensis]